MKETKLSVLRQFGTEQFSMAINIGDTLTAEELKEQVALLGLGITEAFLKVCEREESEKKHLASISKVRLESNQALTKQLDEEMKSATAVSNSVRNAEKIIRKANYK